MSLRKILDKLRPRRTARRKRDLEKRILRFQLPKTEDTSLKVSVLEYCIRKLSAEVFIETGTYKGVTTALAAKLFKEVHTIELSAELHAATQEKSAKRKNVTCHLGDSGKVMPDLLPGLTERSVFFWLDGHYSGTGTAQGGKNTPIIEEIEAIRASGMKHWIVLVDDLRIFGAQPTHTELDQSLTGYPTVASIVDAFRKADPGVQLGIWGDSLVAVSSAHERPLDEFATALLASRICDDRCADDPARLAETIKAEKRLMKSTPEEAKLLEKLSLGFPSAERFGLAGHYHLWAGLAHLGAKQYSKAVAQLRHTLDLDVRHSRVACYLAQALLGKNMRLEAWNLVAPIRRGGIEHPLLKSTIDALIEKRLLDDLIASGEQRVLKIARKLLPKDPVVFDVGVHVGDWMLEALRIMEPSALHGFEPIPDAHPLIIRRAADDIVSGKIALNNAAVGRESGTGALNVFAKVPAWTSLYQRLDPAVAGSAVCIKVPVLSIDDYCESRSIRRIHFLKVDVEGAELDVLHGAERILSRGDVDFLQFRYGGTSQDAGITLVDVSSLLKGHGMVLFRITPDGLRAVVADDQKTDDHPYPNFLAVHRRLEGHVLGQTIDPGWRHHFEQLKLKPASVVHVGAHEGKEQLQYEELGFTSMLWVEANPVVFEELKRNVGSRPGAKLFSGAASDQSGTVELHLASMDQSSSLLPLKKHLEIYPDIKEIGRVSVRAARLDDIMAEAEVKPETVTLLNIDVQGAELKVLRGAANLLRHVQSINVEVNLEELYEGSPLLADIDAELESHGFQRAALDTPYHPLWGDAFYVRRGCVSMSSLGTNGRFGNQFFQYFFLKIYGATHRLAVQTPDWIGRRLFKCTDYPCKGPPLPELRDVSWKVGESPVASTDATIRDIDLWGYFQFHTSYYRPHRDFARALFRPTPDLAAQLESRVAKLRSKGRTIVALHVRRGDYGTTGCFYRTPVSWCRAWLQRIWPTLDNPVLYIASDDAHAVRTELADFNPVIAEDLGICDLPGEASFLPDFFIMSQADVLAIANSSFSFAAAMLNKRCVIFARPQLASKGFIAFDPWNSEVLLRDNAEDFGPGWLD